jgi:hypothetical protein
MLEKAMATNLPLSLQPPSWLEWQIDNANNFLNLFGHCKLDIK